MISAQLARTYMVSFGSILSEIESTILQTMAKGGYTTSFYLPGLALRGEAISSYRRRI
jgi:hypothetical protein